MLLYDFITVKNNPSFCNLIFFLWFLAGFLLCRNQQYKMKRILNTGSQYSVEIIENPRTFPLVNVNKCQVTAAPSVDPREMQKMERSIEQLDGEYRSAPSCFRSRSFNIKYGPRVMYYSKWYGSGGMKLKCRGKIEKWGIMKG